MRLQQFIIFLVAFPLLLALEGEKQRKYILLIGDSVDRYLLNDYCEDAGGDMCTHGDTASCMKHTSSSLESDKLQYIETNIFDDTQKQKTVCFCFASSVTVVFLFNKNGVTPKRFCVDYQNPPKVLASMNISERIPTKTFVQLSLTTKIASIQKLLGSMFHAVIIQSSFWDLSAFHDCGQLKSYQNESDFHHIVSFVDQWKFDCNAFVEALNESPTFQQTLYKAWRTPHIPIHHPTETKSYWTNHIGEYILKRMQVDGPVIAKKHNFSVINFHQFPRVNITRNSKDHHHPNHKTSAMLVKFVLDKLESIGSSEEKLHLPRSYTNDGKAVNNASVPVP